MSLSYFEFTCSRCVFHDVNTVLWGRMNYQTRSGLIPVQRSLGWCVACGGLAPIEVLPSRERLLWIETKEYHSPWSMLAAGEPPTSEQMNDHAEYARLAREDDLRDERTRMEALGGRESAPRCLSCGSVEVVALPEGIDPPGTWDKPEAPVPVGMAHPGCDGELLVKHSDMRVRMSIPERVYTVEGALVQGPEVAEVDPMPRQQRLFD
jgi:hypothetical protein